MVNLISKTPADKPEFNLLLNGTSAGGADISQFYSRKWKHAGTTIFSSYNYNNGYDPSGLGFSAIKHTERITINPKIFYMQILNQQAGLELILRKKIVSAAICRF